MKQTELCSKYLKLRTNEITLMCTRQINYCLSFIRKRKKQFYGNLDIKDVTDNTKFWKTIWSLFSDKTKSLKIMILLKKDKVVTDNSNIYQNNSAVFSIGSH